VLVFVFYIGWKRGFLFNLELSRRAKGGFQQGVVSTLSIDDRIKLEINRAKRYLRPLTVVAIDVNHSTELEPFCLELITRLRALDILVIPPVSSTQCCLVICPETSSQGWPGLRRRLSIGWEGKKVVCGFADFPEDGEWFDSLARVATKRVSK